MSINDLIFSFLWLSNIPLYSYSTLPSIWASLVAQLVKNVPANSGDAEMSIFRLTSIPTELKILDVGPSDQCFSKPSRLF